MGRKLDEPTTARSAAEADWDGMWRVLEPSIREGVWFPIPRDFTKAQAQAFWCAPNHRVFVGERGGEIVWTYYTAPLQLGGGSHVANGGYAVAPAHFGRGLGREMIEHSLAAAKSEGYRAMVYATVLSTNKRAVSLYKRAGFNVVGELPDGYLHPQLGYVSTFFMHRPL